MAPKFTRRELLIAGGALAVTAACGDDGSEAGAANNGTNNGVNNGDNNGVNNGENNGVNNGELPPEPIPDGMAAVGISGRENVEGAVREAIRLAGGIEEIQPGQTVFIKPNAVHNFILGPAIVTSIDVLQAVVRIVKERNPGRIIVGDRPARGFDSERVLDRTGMGAAAMEAGADEIHAPLPPADDPGAWVLMQPPSWEETWEEEGGILAMRAIVEADHFINLPVCKDHRWAVFSLSLKNLIGAVGDSTRDPMHYIREMPDQLSRDIAILNGAFSPTINILDARSALLNGGPEGTGPESVRSMPGLIAASKDRVALDAFGISLLKHQLAETEVPMPDEAQAFITTCSPFACPQILHARDLGIGIDSPDKVLLRFDDVGISGELENIYAS